MSNEQLAAAIQSGQVELYLDLWTGVERYVRKEAGRWARAWRRPEDEEDLVQSGYLALVNAVEDFDPARGGFLTWFTFHLRKAFGACLGVRGQADPLQSAVSLDTPVGEDTEAVSLGDTLEGLDFIADADRRLYLEQLRAALEAELARLPPEQADTLRRRFFGCETRKEIAQASGMSEYQVRAAEQRGILALRRPKSARRLVEFVELRTNYFRRCGPHGVEDIVSHREFVGMQFTGGE